MERGVLWKAISQYIPCLYECRNALNRRTTLKSEAWEKLKWINAQLLFITIVTWQYYIGLILLAVGNSLCCYTNDRILNKFIVFVWLHFRAIWKAIFSIPKKKLREGMEDVKVIKRCKKGRNFSDNKEKIKRKNSPLLLVLHIDFHSNLVEQMDFGSRKIFSWDFDYKFMISNKNDKI